MKPLRAAAASNDEQTAWPSFAQVASSLGQRLRRSQLSWLQLNLGLLCNQACRHCHVDAGPHRREIMSEPTIRRIVQLLTEPGGSGVETVDLTGGAPELNPGFRSLVRSCHRLGKRVIDRCNLTVLMSEPGDTARFLAEHRVEIVASLPCYTQENVERQRGRGVFGASIAALRRLNELGYGQVSSGLRLRLVYNPLGPQLPPPQRELEAAYREHLGQRFGIVFNDLLSITNMPIRRFRRSLERDGRLDDYLRLLQQHLNPQTLPAVMCRELLSVSWDGRLFDCDFNQMLEMPPADPRRTIWEIESLTDLNGSEIAVDDHCFGCVAGAGSSCNGALQ